MSIERTGPRGRRALTTALASFVIAGLLVVAKRRVDAAAREQQMSDSD